MSGAPAGEPVAGDLATGEDGHAGRALLSGDVRPLRCGRPWREPQKRSASADPACYAMGWSFGLNFNMDTVHSTAVNINIGQSCAANAEAL